MRLGPIRKIARLMLAAALVFAVPAGAPESFAEPKAKKSKAAKKTEKKTDNSEAAPKAASKGKVDEYLRARAAFEKKLDAYWDDIASKRRTHAEAPRQGGDRARRLCADAAAGL